MLVDGAVAWSERVGGLELTEMPEVGRVMRERKGWDSLTFNSFQSSESLKRERSGCAVSEAVITGEDLSCWTPHTRWKGELPCVPLALSLGRHFCCMLYACSDSQPTLWTNSSGQPSREKKQKRKKPNPFVVADIFHWIRVDRAQCRVWWIPFQAQGRAETMLTKVGKRKRSTGVSLALWIPHLEGFWVPEITLTFPNVNSWKGYGGGLWHEESKQIYLQFLGHSCISVKLVQLSSRNIFCAME